MQDTFENRSRIVKLAYKVIAETILPREDMPDAEIYALLGAAFFRRAAEAAEADVTPPNGQDRDRKWTPNFSQSRGD